MSEIINIRQKKFFTAISAVDEDKIREAIPYRYNISIGILEGTKNNKFEYLMKVRNPIMPFIMDRVRPGEQIDLYLVICKGDSVEELGKYEERYLRKIKETIQARCEEIVGRGINVGDKDINNGEYMKISSFVVDCDLAQVKEKFQAKHSPDADFDIRIQFVTDDNYENKRYGNSAKSYIRLFLNLMELIEDNDTIYIDYTYGFKPLVHIWRSICAFAARSRNQVEIDALSYGSLKGIGNDVPTIYNHIDFFGWDEIITDSANFEDNGKIIKSVLEDFI